MILETKINYLKNKLCLISLRISEVDDLASVDYQWW